MVIQGPLSPDEGDEDDEERKEYVLAVLMAWVEGKLTTFEADIYLQLK